MEHRIETTVPHFWADSVRIALGKAFPGNPAITVKTPTGSNVTVFVRGNGALLRDVVTQLDWAGMLD